MTETDKNDWNVPSSDDEQDSSTAGKTQGKDQWEIPLKVLLLYSEIEKNGVIELKVKECRRSKENVIQSFAVSKEGEIHRVSDAAEEKNGSKENTGKDAIPVPETDKEKMPALSAFDYTEECIDESSHLTRKIPKTERFQRKRVGTLENVISDLKRFRDMDNEETDEKETLHTYTPTETDAVAKDESS